MVAWPIAYGPVLRQHIMEKRMWQSKAAQIVVTRKQKETRRGQVPTVPQGHTPQSPNFLPLDPLNVLSPLNSTEAGDQNFNTGTFGGHPRSKIQQPQNPRSKTST